MTPVIRTRVVSRVRSDHYHQRVECVIVPTFMPRMCDITSLLFHNRYLFVSASDKVMVTRDRLSAN